MSEDSDWDARMERHRAQQETDRKAAEEARVNYYRQNGHYEFETATHENCLWPTKCWCKCPTCCAASLIAGGPSSLNIARIELTALESFKLEGAKSAFFSETTLYKLIGKGDARTVLSYIHRLREAIGENGET